jgi:pyruvate/2-oxoacid:ferredoxin oxidoreductase alpha subunit
MVQTLKTALRPIALAGAEAALLGLLAAGCRLIFASASAAQSAGDGLRRAGRRTEGLGGAWITVQSDQAAAAMAAGAALRGARAAAIVADAAAADLSLAGLDDLPLAIVDVSGRLPLTLTHVRVLLSPCIPQGAYEAGRGLFAQADALRGPGLIAGLGLASGPVTPCLAATPEEAWPVPIHHHGPDDPDLLILGSGPGFEACEGARQQLEDEGIAAAHLHLMQVSPFPGAIVAPAITSARRVLVVEPGGPGHLAAYIRSNLGAPAEPFGELPRLADTPLRPDEIAHRAREVMAL